jgi:small subunit ribosomal protein S6e
MMAFKLVVSDPKTRQSYQREVGEEGLLGKKIGEKVQGSVVGLEGYELEITGGSDNDGFPMRRDVEGAARKKILISAPPGFHPGSPGVRKRKSVRGNTISADNAQINTKVVKYGKKTLAQLFGTKKKEEKPKEAEGEKAGKKEEPAAEKPAEEKAEQKAEEKPEEKAAGQPEEKAEEEPVKEEKPGEKAEPAETAGEGEASEQKPEEKGAEEQKAANAPEGAEKA